MSEARSFTNLIGNGVATVVVAKWEGEFDAAQAAVVLNCETFLPDAPDGKFDAASEAVV